MSTTTPTATQQYASQPEQRSSPGWAVFVAAYLVIGGTLDVIDVLPIQLQNLRRKLPVDPVARLRQQLEKAVKIEDYEEAARLRDEIQKREEVPKESEESHSPGI